MADTNPTAELVAGAENYLAALDDKSFADLVSRTRTPADPNKPAAPAKPDSDPAPTDYPAGWKNTRAGGA